MSQHRTMRALGLIEAIALCQRLDAAERDAIKARAALLIARHGLNRVRLGSLLHSRRCKQ